MINDTRNRQSIVLSDREYWEKTLLRKTDLESYQYINGTVFISPIVSASTYHLYTPIGGISETAVFKFRQTVFYP